MARAAGLLLGNCFFNPNVRTPRIVPGRRGCSLISVLFIGVSAYREGSNRAKCILNMSNVQKAVGDYQNLYEKNEGDTLALTDLVGSGKLIETSPVCPSGGIYTAAGSVPTVGTVYLTCSLAGSNDHVPNSVDGW